MTDLHEFVTTKKEGTKLWVIQPEPVQIDNLSFGIFHAEKDFEDNIFFETGPNKKLVFMEHNAYTT